MSKYDNIKTATALVSEVKANGLSMETEDICRAQDILGCAQVEELAFLANNETYQGAFYMTITRIWNWSQVVQFWNAHTNPQTEELKRMQSAFDFTASECDRLNNELGRLRGERSNLVKELEDSRIRIGDVQRAAEEAEAEVVRLKAKLYDVLVEGKEGA